MNGMQMNGDIIQITIKKIEMKNSIINLGKIISKESQKEIRGGLRHFFGHECKQHGDCTNPDHDFSACCSGVCVHGISQAHLQGLTCLH